MEQPANELEWEESGSKTTRPSVRVRCLPDRLGSIVPGLTDRRPVVQAGENSPHKLSELLAATLAVKTFLKNHENKRVLLLLDNQTAVAYKNNLGGTVSTNAAKLVELWMWCLQRDILLTAQYLPGKENVRADTESRVMRDRCDWMLNPLIFQKVLRHFPHLEVNLFAT